ncbi:MAG: phosphate/phosphite/phosphonate ABC transporter substrate-binding protein [Nitrosomonas sp.]|nr:phosphate/phosphite/phosphonate ABC transporter substrate-binding protein [Nitrosomonas sp.]
MHPQRLWIIFFLFLIGCGNDFTEKPQTINVSALPDRSSEAVREQHVQLIESICNKIDITCQWVDSPDYKSLVHQFGKGEIDLAYLGGVTFILAHERYGAIPLVMRDIDMHFTSSIYVHENNNTINDLKDLKGKAVSFGPFYSTSGHIMPRYYLRRKNIESEKYFALTTHSSGHDDTLAQIVKGEIDAGIVNSHIAEDILHDKKLPLKLIWETPPYMNYVWVIHPSMSDSLQTKLQNAFLELNISAPVDKIILEKQGARGYLPVLIDDFIDVQHAARYLLSEQNLPAEQKK